MPKSISTLRNQLSNCEKSMNEAIEMCVATVGTADPNFFINVKDLMANITTCDLNKAKTVCDNLLEVVNQASKVVELETKRRKYKDELHKKIEDRKRKNSVKKRQMERTLRNVNNFQFLSLPSSQEPENDVIQES